MVTLVFLDKDVYFNKMSELLDDDETYEKLRSSPLKRLSAQFNKSVKELLRNGDIDPNRFIQINPKLAHIYGNPKTLKDNVPMRPIISTRNTFIYKLSKFLADKLAPLVGSFSFAHISTPQIS